METPEQQEARAREAFSLPAALKAGIGAGILFFVMSGGSPWSSGGTMNAIMGRDVPGAALHWVALQHFALALVYAVVVGFVIYRFKTPVGVTLGIVVTMGLYLLNLFVFKTGGFLQQTVEFRPFFVHLMFGLFVSLLYKAMSVPPPLEMEEATR